MRNPLWIFVILALSLPLAAQASRSKKKKTLGASISRMIDETFVKAPADDEVCFAPEEPCDIKLTKFAGSAQKTLDIAIFDFNLDQLAHEILIQSKKLEVRLVVDRRMAKGEHSLVPMLVKAGARVRYGRQRGIMHNKFMIVDGNRLETGSFNYTNGAAFKNSENQVYLAKPEIVARYQQRFDKLWAEGDAVSARVP